MISLARPDPWALALLLAFTPLAACRSGVPAAPHVVQPGAPGQDSRIVDAHAAADLSKVPFTAADVRFMQGMIGHHAQALEMTGLVRSHGASDAIGKLAERIELSQADEIKMMQDWLTRRGQQIPDAHAHHAPGATAAPLMPGMLTAAEMARLDGARGAEFDRLFIELMIKHHEGALAMVQQLFAQPGAGQEADVFAFASDVDADQRMEIDRMRSVLVTSKEPVR